MEGIFGLRAHTTGKVWIKGQEVTIKQPRDAIQHSVALLTEDRRATGIMGVLSVADNISIASLDALRKGPIMLDDKRGDGDVIGHAQHTHDAGGAAVLGQQSHAVLDGVAGLLDGDFLTLDPHLTGGAVSYTHLRRRTEAYILRRQAISCSACWRVRFCSVSSDMVSLLL